MRLISVSGFAAALLGTTAMCQTAPGIAPRRTRPENPPAPANMSPNLGRVSGHLKGHTSAALPAADQQANVIQTIAGTTWLFSAPGRSAKDAPLGLSYYGILDPKGNLVFSDRQNHMIFRIGS